MRPCHTPNVCSGRVTRRSVSAPAPPSSGTSTRHTSTSSALVEATANRTPSGSAWAPRGKTGTIGQDRQVKIGAGEPDLTDLVVHMEGVAVRRGPSTLVQGVDWDVELDERWVVLGPNGAGK